MTRRQSRDSPPSLQQLQLERALSEALRERSKEFQKVAKLYDAQAALSRRALFLIAAGFAFSIGFCVAINYSAWSVALSLAGMSSSLYTGAYLSFAVCAADGVCAKLQSQIVRETFRRFVARNQIEDDTIERFDAEVRESFQDTVLLPHRGQYKQFRSLRQFLQANRAGVLGASFLVLGGQVSILLLKVAEIREKRIFHWIAAISLYALASLLLWILRKGLMKRVRAASDEIARNGIA